MSIKTKSVTVPKGEDKTRRDTGTVTPGTPEYTFQAIESYEGDPRQFVVEALSTYFKGSVADFNEFLTDALNRKLRIESRPGVSEMDKLLARMAAQLGVSVEEVKAALPAKK